jgi:hypothetical protein
MRRRGVTGRGAAFVLGLALAGERIASATPPNAAAPRLRGIERLDRQEVEPGPSWRKPADAAGGVSAADDWLG